MSARTVVSDARTVHLQTPMWRFNAMISDEATLVTLSHKDGGQVAMDRASMDDFLEFAAALEAAEEEFRNPQDDGAAEL